MDANQTKQASPEPRKPKRRIVVAFMLVLVAMGLLPLGVTAYKLIDISRESLVTSQQEAQLQVAASMARQLNSSVDALEARMARLADAMATLPKGPNGRPLDTSRGRALLREQLGSDLLLIRYTPRRGDALEARRKGFQPGVAVEETMAANRGAALDGRTAVSDPFQPTSGAGTQSVMAITVPVGAPRSTGTLTGVIDFEGIWGEVVAGRRTPYTI